MLALFALFAFHQCYPRPLYSRNGSTISLANLIFLPFVHIYLLNSCTIHTLAHLRELPLVLRHSIISLSCGNHLCLTFLSNIVISPVHCTTIISPLCSNSRRVPMRIVSYPIFGVGYWERGSRVLRTTQSPFPPSLTGRTSPRPPTLISLPLLYTSWPHELVSTCFPQETPFKLEHSDTGKR